MTKEEKRDRRNARHQAQSEIRRVLNSRMGMYATNAQLRAATKTITDRAISAAVNNG